jgi:hypothetical protein
MSVNQQNNEILRDLRKQIDAKVMELEEVRIQYQSFSNIIRGLVEELNSTHSSNRVKWNSIIERGTRYEDSRNKALEKFKLLESEINELKRQILSIENKRIAKLKRNMNEEISQKNNKIKKYLNKNINKNIIKQINTPNFNTLPPNEEVEVEEEIEEKSGGKKRSTKKRSTKKRTTKK